MLKILIAGATGMLGNTLAPILAFKGYDVYRQGFSNHADLRYDFRCIDQVRYCISTLQPDVIINLIALTDVSECQDNLHQAYLINTKIVENIVNVIRGEKFHPYLIQLSTDHVYDGLGIHDEEDTRLLNNYAITKYAAELAALRIDSTILRTNFIGPSNAKNRQSLTDWVYNSCLNKIPIHTFNDVFYNPLSMVTLSEVIDVVVEKRLPGIFNLGSKFGMSKAESIAVFVKKIGLSDKLITKIESSKVLSSVFRPKNMQMDVSKFESGFGISLPTFENEISRIARDYA